jgi:uncharacterized protein (DUF1778 family)
MAKEKRVNRLTIMFSDTELAKIDEAAAALGHKRATFIRNSALLDAWKIMQSATTNIKDHRSATRLYSS